jgi:Asp-tRNAAsn/Glu-tRNAGln amidotransferase B subunit (PET112 homolog)
VVNLQEGGLTHKQCADILNYMLEHGGNAKQAQESLHIVMQVSDDGAVLGFVSQVLDANPQSIVDYKAGKDRAIGFLIGQVMKLSHGKVNPAAVARIMAEEIKKR